MYPQTFDKATYIAWHENKFPEDSKLENKLDALRKDLVKDLREDLKFLADLLYYLIPACNNEYKIQHNTEFQFQIPLVSILDEPSSLQYELIFKSTDSIINKMWRKNKEEETLNLGNITQNINDLVRTEVICSTLAACEFISKRLALKNINLPPDYHLKQTLDEKVHDIIFEPEMKMSSGYFAYHGLAKLKNGISIEIQIYSALTSNWRKLSHKLYDKVRLKPIEKHDFGTSESRLISLGHLLHLAECEVERLEKEIQ